MGGSLRSVVALESIGCEEGGAPDCLLVEFLHGDSERIPIHEVPGVAMKFSLNIGDEAGRPVELQSLAAPEGDPKQRIEADKVVHVRVRNEDVACALEAGGPERIVVAEVEEEGTFGPTHFHEQAGIAEDIVDEMA